MPILLAYTNASPVLPSGKGFPSLRVYSLKMESIIAKAFHHPQHTNMCEDLDRPQHSFKHYCSDDLSFEMWICNSFLADLL